ncbi:MAG: hypothetical protein CHACPFDD_01419 [Phycisphaerae bacterium]|nr:hypothetical protein [Phycisphaerae bacterium]
MKPFFGTLARWIRWIALATICTPAAAQLRVATWNVSNYDGGRASDIQAAVYGVFETRSLDPDIIIAQEFISSSAVTEFKSYLNGACGCSNDWDAATFVNGPDTDSAFFFRKSRVTLLATVLVATGGGSPLQPRNVMRYDVRLKNYTAAGATLSCYSSHMKAVEAGSDDDDRRLYEAQIVRGDAEALPAGWNFLIGADFNIQTSNEAAYQELVGSQVNNAGRFFDPIKSPGSWNNSAAYKILHTQDPAGAGGMDDRFDQILLSSGLVDGGGFDYVGNPNLTYSTSTWNDPNHSYRAWGNDGTSLNDTLTVTGNQMVGAAIAQAIINCADGAGHIPVFLDLRVPPEIDADASVSFGVVTQGSVAQQPVHVFNAGDTALWGPNGIANLSYSLAASAGFSAPGGSFSDAAGGSQNTHTLTMDTSTPGIKSGTLTISSNSPDEPTLVVALSGEVVADCVPCDTNCDGSINGFDVDTFVALLAGSGTPCQPCAGDVNGDGSVNGFDIDEFVAALTGGPC